MRRSSSTPPAGRIGPLLSALLVLAPMVGCKSEGQLELFLDLPISGRGLNPMDDQRLDHFSLIVTGTDGEVRTINNVPYAPGTRSFAIGRVPAGPHGGLTLIGYSALNQVLAYGEAGPVTVDETGKVSVNVALRKPFTYVAGGPQIMAFDTTRADSDDTLSPLPATGGTTTDIAATPDGRYLLVSVADFSAVPTVAPTLKLFTTAYHEPGKEIPLVFKPGHISLSPDGRWAVVAEHRSEDPDNPGEPADQVAIVDMQTALNSADPTQAVRTVNMANASRVAFVRNRQGVDLAVILRDAMPHALGCNDGAAPSILSTIRLDTGLLEGSPVELGIPARDLTSDPRDHRVFVADPCNHQVIQFDADAQVVDGYPWNFRDVTLQHKQLAPYSLIVSGTRLWVGLMDDVGQSSEDPAQVYVGGVEGWSDPTRSSLQILTVPFPSEAVQVLTNGGAPGARVLVDMEPWRLRVYRISVPPGDNRLSVLVRAEYYTSPITLQGETGDLYTLPAVEIFSESYLGLDTGSAGIRRRYRARCVAQRLRPPDDPVPLACQRLADHEQPETGFSPRGATSIYGVP